MKISKIFSLIGIGLYVLFWLLTFPSDVNLYLELGLIPYIYFTWLAEGIIIYFAFKYVMSWDKGDEDGME